MNESTSRLVEYEAYHNHARVFRDRQHAGEVLAEMLASYRNSDALVLGIAAGGVPVAAVIAGTLRLPLELLVVKKITPPDNTEFGYGAIAWDGNMIINYDTVARLGLSNEDVERGIELCRAKIAARLRKFRGHRPFPDISGRTVILVDDGLATGVTFMTCIGSLRNQDAASIVGAIPTAHYQSATHIAESLDVLYCANIRTGYRYAVADAYESWHDVSDNEVMEILASQVSGN